MTGICFALGWQETRGSETNFLSMSNDREPRPRYSPEMTGIARRLRREMTPAERRLWEIVRERKCGHRFYRQVPAGQYILDFYCPQARLAIEVDGGIHSLPDVEKRDRDREATLTEDLKLSFLRLTNEETLTTDEAILRENIISALESAIQTAPPWNERPARRR